MSDDGAGRKEYLAGVPCWVDTAHPDPQAAVAFYAGLFGWEFVDRSPGEGPKYFIGQLRGRAVAGVGGQGEDDAADASWNMYVAVDSADDAADRVGDAGGSVLIAPFDVGDAGRMAVFADPSGASFCVWQAGSSPGAELVNEPGTWNFSELNTRDRDGSIEFYNRVFGWEHGEMGFWRLPGYGDFLERDDPELRDRMSGVGAPDGFEDAVAWLVPMSDDRFPPETPPHWTITFAVDDADATAKRAEELGGTVLAEPMDAPWVRMTVLRDPQGAVFTASKFVPPQ